MKKFCCFVILALLLAIFPLFFVSASTRISIPKDGITFSKAEILEGDSVKIYARIFDTGDTDVLGYVVFLNNGKEISDPKPFFVRPNSYDDVFMNWVASAGPNYIGVKLIESDPPDNNPADIKAAEKNVFVRQAKIQNSAVAESKNAAAESNLYNGGADNGSSPSSSGVEDKIADNGFSGSGSINKVSGFVLNAQENLKKFAEANPIKSGIDKIDQKISDKASEWYHLVLGENKNANFPKNQNNFSFDPSESIAGLIGLVQSFLKSGNNYIYVGLGILSLLIIFFLLRRKRNKPNN